jgi:hypothetical protein
VGWAITDVGKARTRLHGWLDVRHDDVRVEELVAAHYY